jgi:hypothetical protein
MLLWRPHHHTTATEVFPLNNKPSRIMARDDLSLSCMVCAAQKQQHIYIDRVNMSSGRNILN